jgi:hypothetical protein
MKFRTLALLTAALLPALAQAAPAQASKQQCLGYLKDGFQIVIHVSACEPASAQDERYKNAFNAAQQQFEQANCESLLNEAEVRTFLDSQTAGKSQQQYCAPSKPPCSAACNATTAAAANPFAAAFFR